MWYVKPSPTTAESRSRALPAARVDGMLTLPGRRSMGVRTAIESTC